MLKTPKFKLLLLVVLTSIFCFQCSDDSEVLIENNLNIKTVSNSEALDFLNDLENIQQQSRSITQPYVTIYDDHISNFGITNSDEVLTVLPAVLAEGDAYSRVFLLNVDGEIQSVVYSMYSFNDYSTENFYGEVLITDLEGTFINRFKVVDGLMVTKYIESNNNQEETSSRTNNCYCPWECHFCELDEVVIEASPRPELGDLYTSVVPESYEDQTYEITSAPGGGGGGNGPNSPECTNGQILNGDGVCVDADEDCGEGYILNIHGVCVEPNIEDMPPDCDSFEYSRVGTTTWQCSAVVGVNELFTVFNWDCSAWNMAFFLSPMYFQLPINVNYSLNSGSTKTESAIRLHDAFKAFDNWYDEHGCEDNSALAIEDILLGYIKEEFEEAGGNVTMVPPLGFNGETTAYKSNWLGYGICF